jgi:hypothetical protein
MGIGICGPIGKVLINALIVQVELRTRRYPKVGPAEIALLLARLEGLMRPVLASKCCALEGSPQLGVGRTG